MLLDAVSFTIGAKAIFTSLTQIGVVWCSWLSSATGFLNRWTIEAIKHLANTVEQVK